MKFYFRETSIRICKVKFTKKIYACDFFPKITRIFVVLYPVYTIEQTSSKHQANVQQTSSRHRTNIEQTSSRPDGTPPSGSNVGLGLAHS